MTLVALSLDGRVMGTVETRLPEEGIGGLVSLKFWTRGQQNKDFSLSTVVYEPHRYGVSFMLSEIVMRSIWNVLINYDAPRIYCYNNRLNS